jgi:glycosyltransferase involved in cell wall biosynthesis
LIQAWYTARADLVICPSLYLGKVVAGWGVREASIKIVYNAVHFKRPEVVASPDHNIVTVSRLVPWKGIGELIRIAVKRGWSLLVVGDGPLRAELQTMAARLPGARIEFTGHVDAAEVPAQIRRAAVFVLNSSYEGLPHIVLEAKLAGVPVIATAAGGTPEAVGSPEAGLLVPVGDCAALESAVARLLASDAERHALIVASDAQMASKFSFTKMVKDTERALAGGVA